MNIKHLAVVVASLVSVPAFAETIPLPPEVTPAIAAPAPLGLSWRGSLETDVGRARYSFDTAAYRKETFNDFRGRFVFGPTWRRDLGDGRFAEVRGEVVTWLRETLGVYQVNADDVWARFGQTDRWDVQIGRFMTWPVYYKGLGFDLYTLDDTGALEVPPFESGQFGPDIYEVNLVFLRETAGRVAAHVYPTPWSGLEVAGVYGKNGTVNTVGGRGAGRIVLPHVRVTAGGEYRVADPAQQSASVSTSGELVVCERCGHTERWGFGGGAALTWRPVEMGVNAARSRQRSWSIKDGTPDKNAAAITQSVGGYVEVDVGTLVMGRALVLGGGVNRTEILFQTDDFKRHVQWAGYLAYPLGRDGAMLKFVLSRADLLTEDNTGDGVQFLARNSRMLSGRVRLFFPF